MNIKDLKNKVIAHRGIHNNKTVPENSIKAFEKAIKRKIPIELDVHILKDNTLPFTKSNTSFRVGIL